MNILIFLGGLLSGVGAVLFSLLYLGKAGMKARDEAVSAVRQGQAGDHAKYKEFMDRQHAALLQIQHYQQKTYEKLAAILEHLRSDSSRLP